MAHDRLRKTASPPLALPPESPSIIAILIAEVAGWAPAKAGANAVAARDFKAARRDLFMTGNLLKSAAGCADGEQAAIDARAAQFKGSGGTYCAAPPPESRQGVPHVFRPCPSHPCLRSGAFLRPHPRAFPERLLRRREPPERGAERRSLDRLAGRPRRHP